MTFDKIEVVSLLQLFRYTFESIPDTLLFFFFQTKTAGEEKPSTAEEWKPAQSIQMPNARVVLTDLGLDASSKEAHQHSLERR